MSKFNFITVIKQNFVRNHSTETDDKDNTIRLSSNGIRVGGNIMKRLFKDKLKTNGPVSVTIAKDPEKEALLLIPATDKSPQRSVFSLSQNDGGRIFRMNSRPKALYDMPNGVYMEDMKEPNVFILID